MVSITLCLKRSKGMHNYLRRWTKTRVLCYGNLKNSTSLHRKLVSFIAGVSFIVGVCMHRKQCLTILWRHSPVRDKENTYFTVIGLPPPITLTHQSTLSKRCSSFACGKGWLDAILKQTSRVLKNLNDQNVCVDYKSVTKFGVPHRNCMFGPQCSPADHPHTPIFYVDSISDSHLRHCSPGLWVTVDQIDQTSQVGTPSRPDHQTKILM